MLKVCSITPLAIRLTAAGSLTAISKSVQCRSKRLNVSGINTSRLFMVENPPVLIPSPLPLTGSSVGSLRRAGQQSEEPSRLAAGCGRTPEPGHTDPALASADVCHWSLLHHGPGWCLILWMWRLYVSDTSKGTTPKVKTVKTNLNFLLSFLMQEAFLSFSTTIKVFIWNYSVFNYGALLEHR